MATVLVTGAAGFIGSHLCERLIARGDCVIGLDNFNDFYDPEIKRSNLRALLDSGDFRFVEGDIRDSGALTRAFADSDLSVVVHLAAMAGVTESILNPREYVDVNVQGTVAVTERVRESLIPNYVFASSSSVYGANQKVPFSEKDPLTSILSPYAATKAACELLLKNYADLHGMNISCLRFFTVYGPRQRPEMAIHKFVRHILNGKPIDMFGDGSSSRDYTYIDDIIQGVLGAIDHNEGFAVYNLGESQSISLKDLITLLQDVCGKKARVRQLDMQPGDAPKTFASVAKAREHLGYNPTTSIRQGLERFLEWYRQEFPTA